MSKTLVGLTLLLASLHPAASAPVMVPGEYDVTNYCVAGTMSDGHHTHVGAVAVLDRAIPFGTKLSIDSHVYIVEDHVGHGTDFDIFNPSCASAMSFGREHVMVSEYHTPVAQEDRPACTMSFLGHMCAL
jgi:3D (Asp-Asp-Asp) domain-containing protein